MKNFLTFLLAITFIFLLSACGEEKPMNDIGSNISRGLQNNQSYEAKISEDEALDIALTDAGVSKDEITGQRINLDYDDGVYHYEVHFNVGQTEYDYDIHADDGRIRDRDRDLD